MGDEEALLGAIRANPAEDVPRLMYADWLDERGEPGDAARAKFIRDQIGAVGREDVREVYAPPRSRIWDLLEMRPWLLDGPGAEGVWVSTGGLTGVLYRRGFVSAVSVTLGDWCEEHPRIQRHPVTDVWVQQRKVYQRIRPDWDNQHRWSIEGTRYEATFTPDAPLGRVDVAQAILDKYWPSLWFRIEYGKPRFSPRAWWPPRTPSEWYAEPVAWRSEA